MDKVKLLPCEGMTNTEIKALWVKHGGSQHGPHIEHYTIEEQAFYRFAKALIEASRPPIVTDEVVERVEFDDGAGVVYTIAKLREELDGLYRSQPQKDAPKIRPGAIHEAGPSIIGRLQHIDHLQRYQIACLERHLALALNPPRHKFWGAGEPDCPREIKAGNGELHTLRCKVCGTDDPRTVCRAAPPAQPENDQCQD